MKPSVDQFLIAKSAAAEGIKRSAEHAEAKHPGWSNLGLLFLERHARLHESFTSEELRFSAEQWGLVPPATPKAWGSVFRRAAKLRIIVKDGYDIALQRHCSPCVRWRSLVCKTTPIRLQVAGEAA